MSNWKLPVQLSLPGATKKSPKPIRDFLTELQPTRAQQAGQVIDFYLMMLMIGRRASLLCLQSSGISI
ncbi:hypothetical protein I7I53_01678 [Histoplasma capsulatum var. duboisii H88]|uniref:Uncharacterized protein n=1 Tax=Ajellomyces capsulatus (strain H88) TaxID=544711 RepID=A0A8A1LMA2_AJEC8|nr:hypothetical protein I7I53_01678 [Histoplasma capsulatum var. duboisii H88]